MGPDGRPGRGGLQIGKLKSEEAQDIARPPRPGRPSGPVAGVDADRQSPAAEGAHLRRRQFARLQLAAGDDDVRAGPAKARTICSSSPREPPVTRAILPDRSKRSVMGQLPHIVASGSVAPVLDTAVAVMELIGRQGEAKAWTQTATRSVTKPSSFRRRSAAARHGTSRGWPAAISWKCTISWSSAISPPPWAEPIFRAARTRFAAEIPGDFRRWVPDAARWGRWSWGPVPIGHGRRAGLL